MNDDCAIVILSCDKYFDLWEPMAQSVFEYLGTLNLPTYLVSNEMSFEFPKVTNIMTGPDTDWSTSFRKALQKIPEGLLFVLLDDMPLIARPDLNQVTECFSLIASGKLDTLHPRPIPGKRRFHTQYENWFAYTSTDNYTCNVLAFWRKSILEDVIRPGESAWDFEVQGSHRLNELGKSGALTQDLLNYVHLVIKGSWVANVSDLMKYHKLSLNLEARKVIQKRSIEELIKNLIFAAVLGYFPRKLQKRAFRFFNWFSKNQISFALDKKLLTLGKSKQQIEIDS